MYCANLNYKISILYHFPFSLCKLHNELYDFIWQQVCANGALVKLLKDLSGKFNKISTRTHSHLQSRIKTFFFRFRIQSNVQINSTFVWMMEKTKLKNLYFFFTFFLQRDVYIYRLLDRLDRPAQWMADKYTWNQSSVLWLQSFRIAAKQRKRNKKQLFNLKFCNSNTF